MALRTAPCLVVALTMACSSTVSSTDAATSVDVAVDATEAGACDAPRTCFGAAVTPRVLAGVCARPGGELQVEVRSADVSFCRCLHGAGPGVEAAIELDVENHGARTANLDLRAALSMTPVEGGGGLTLGPCCTQSLGRAYSCTGEPTPWRGAVPAGRVEVLTAQVHVDVPEVRAGRYRVALTVTIDGAPRELDLGERSVELRP
jgi:hypothetical protein